MAIRITATNFAVSSHVQTSEALAPLIDRSADWIIERTGVLKRHIAGTIKDPAVLAGQAARPLIEQHGEPDLVLYAGALPRQAVPDTSVFVHRKLRLTSVPCFSINASCLSFLTALKTAEAFIAGKTYSRILICSAELSSLGRNFDEPESAALMGDGAAAAMITAATPGDGSGFEAYRMQTWSDGADLTGVRGGGTLVHPNDPDSTATDHLFHMNGDALLRMTVPRLRRFLDAFLDDANITTDDIDLVIPHQASGPGMRLLTRWGFPEDRVVNIIADYGNCVAASMPMALAIARQQGRLSPGDRVLFLGTAAGISIGAGLFRW
ncbi:MAG: 3-oxoacyl-ACP synthase III family protein [Planctomycetales bacterium]